MQRTRNASVIDCCSCYSSNKSNLKLADDVCFQSDNIDAWGQVNTTTTTTTTTIDIAVNAMITITTFTLLHCYSDARPTREQRGWARQSVQNCAGNLGRGYELRINK